MDNQHKDPASMVDSWLDEIAQERWGDAVVTKPVSVESMHQWLANNPEAFIAAFA